MLKRIRLTRRPVTHRQASAAAPVIFRGAVESLEARTLFNANYFSLASGDFAQHWDDTSALATNNWDNIPSIIGYSGNKVTPTGTATDPQVSTADDASDVNAIKGSSATSATGGVHEITSLGVIGLKGSGSAVAPYLRLHLDTTGRENVTVSYTLRELESKTVDQKFALQYRLGALGTWTNVPAGPAVGGVFSATGQQNANVSAVLPVAVINQSQVQVRIIGHDAAGADAMIGVDDIVVTSTQITSQFLGFDAASTAATVGESAGQVHLTVTRGPVKTGTVTVDYVTADLSAQAGSDYTAKTGTLTFADGVGSQTIDVDVTPDTILEPSQSFTVTLSNPQGTGAVLTASTTSTVTIADDDKPTGGKRLSDGPLSQDWSTTGNQIINDDDWSGVAYITGYRGDDNSTTASGVDPQTILVPRSEVVDVNANKDATYLPVNAAGSGGVAEIDGIANPAVTINGSGTADSPFLLFDVDTTGVSSVDVAYNLRDLDNSADDAVQMVALQYRVGNTGNFTNVPAGFVADATTANADTLVTAVAATVNGADIANQPLVQFRVITSNANGNDEFVGVDDIVIRQTPTAGLPAWVNGAATWNGSTLNVTGAATITADPGSDNPAITADGAAAQLTINPTTDRVIHVAGIALSGGATANLTSIGAGTSVTAQRVLVVGSGGISVTGGAGGLDIHDNAMIVNGMTPAAVQALVVASYHAGAWNTPGGITSGTAAADPTFRHAVAVVANADVNLTSFEGVGGLTGNEVFVKYTFYGDADLNGKVTLDDFTQFLHGYQNGKTTWLEGDFDFNGKVTLDDFTLFLDAYQNQS